MFEGFGKIGVKILETKLNSVSNFKNDVCQQHSAKLR